MSATQRLWRQVKRTLNQQGWDARRLPRRAPSWQGPYLHQIYPRLETIFVHVPKTGGTSVQVALSPWANKRFTGGHTTALEFAFIEPEAWQRYFTFGFVRDPWDRLLSAYQYLMALPPELGISLQDFVRGRLLRYADDFDGFVAHLAAEPTVIYYVPHLRPQHTFLGDPQGHILVDHVARFEAIDAEWRGICQRIGIDVPLPHHRQSTPPTVHPPRYTAQSRAQVATLYQRDIALFGYATPDD